MNLVDLVNKLDVEFSVARNKEDLIKWAVTDLNKNYIYPEFLARKTGLMVKGSDTVDKVLTAVFVTDRIVEKIAKFPNCLLFTHHQFDYYEDERGAQPIKPEIMEKTLYAKNSIYVAHAPLDTHSIYGTSLSLAKLIGIAVDKFFYDYFGAPTAVVGHIPKTRFEELTEKVQEKLQRPHLTLHKYIPFVKTVAVVAGGGDMPDLLQRAYDLGCDTFFTGTVEHRWALPFVKEQNEKFHELNKKLKVNLIGGTHYGTERPAMRYVTELFKQYGVGCEYCEDELLLNVK